MTGGIETTGCTRSLAASTVAAQLTERQEWLLVRMGAAAVLAAVTEPWPAGMFGADGLGERRRVGLTSLGAEVASICQERANG